MAHAWLGTSVWDPSDVRKVLQAVDRGNPCGKRDYAIILLITRLGLRGVDVKRLRFADLDWPGNGVSVVQAKRRATRWRCQGIVCRCSPVGELLARCRQRAWGPCCTIWGMSELPISEARDRLGEVVSRAEHGQERTVLTRHGKPVAVVISIDDLRELEAAEDGADLEAAREALADPVRAAHREVLAEYGIEIA